ncbi:geranyltranstransferase [Escherichia coli]|uniref:Geranyltranstransferase n=1 Tax=Escherichia coli TaxID=562 RepID=A0A376MTE9_ECOLX|nr:geranyltranstransferase [Escherichia coli]
MDFPQQLEACVKQANQALSRFIAPLPFQKHSRGRNHAVWRIIRW